MTNWAAIFAGATAAAPPRSQAEAIAVSALALIARTSRDEDARLIADRALANISALRGGK